MPTHFKPLHERYDIMPDGCWQWNGAQNGNGYGRFRLHGQMFVAHRVFYEQHYSVKIPPSMVIDHLCRNPGCVNPLHMEVVTTGVNTRRAHLRAECQRGHALSGDNLRIQPDGKRKCRACEVLRMRNYRAYNRY